MSNVENNIDSGLPESVRQQYLEAMGIQTWYDLHAPVSAAISISTSIPAIDPLSTKVSTSAIIESEQVKRVQIKENTIAKNTAVEVSTIEAATLEAVALEAKVESKPGERQHPVRGDGEPSNMHALNLRIEQCQMCELHTTRQQAIFGEGHAQAKLFIIIDSPVDAQQNENALLDVNNKNMLQSMLNAIGFDLASVYISSLIKCRPPEQRAPQTSEVICCDEHLSAQIKLIQPQAILVLGEQASQQLLVSQKALIDLRLRRHQHLGVPVFASYHPHELFSCAETKRKVWADLLQIKRQLINVN